MSGRIEDAGHVVVEEATHVRGLSGVRAGPIFHPGERAGQARGHHQHQPGGRGDLPPDQAGPPPREEAAEYAQGQKREMRGHCDELDGFPHVFYGTAAVTPRQVGATATVSIYGALKPRVYEPDPADATTTYR